MTQLDQALAVGPMSLDDLAAVDQIERASFSSPRTTTLYRSELTQNRLAHYWVISAARPDSPLPPILAYGGYWLTGDEANVVVIATAPAWRRVGLGGWLLLEMAAIARAQGALNLTLEVREGNHAARAFYAKLGFQAVGQRKRYYTDTGEDAHLLTLFALDDAAVWQPLQGTLETLRMSFGASSQEKSPQSSR